MANVEDVYHVLLHNLQELLELNLAVGTIVATEAKQDDQLVLLTDIDNSLTSSTVYGDTSSTVSVNRTITSTILKAANGNRKEVILYNNSNGKAWISFNSPAVSGKGVRLMPKSTLFLDHSRTNLYVVWDNAGGGDVSVTEVSV